MYKYTYILCISATVCGYEVLFERVPKRHNQSLDINVALTFYSRISLLASCLDHKTIEYIN